MVQNDGERKSEILQAERGKVSFLYERGQSQILSHGFLSYRSPAASQSETDLRPKAREKTSEVL